MSPAHDVIIAGLGAMGGAAAMHLAQRGRRVLGFDRFHPPHAHGSSHGQSRIIREAYFEHPAYVPLIQRAYELWTRLENDSRRSLYLPTGGVMIGSPDGVLTRGALRSAHTHHLAHEILSAHDIRRRFPAFAPSSEMLGVWEPRAGILFPETCIQAQLTSAQSAGAQLHFHEPIRHWRASSQGVEVQTSHGSYQADHLILTAGSWLGELWTAGQSLLEIERQILFWFESSDPACFQPERCPIFIWEHAPGRFFYGFPDLGTGIKVARHGEGSRTSPDTVDRTVTRGEMESMRELIRPWLPGLNGVCLDATVCSYTNTTDHHFLLDRHPDHPNVWLVSPCSGHGFKFAQVVGEILAQWIAGEPMTLDVTLFKLKS